MSTFLPFSLMAPFIIMCFVLFSLLPPSFVRATLSSALLLLLSECDSFIALKKGNCFNTAMLGNAWMPEICCKPADYRQT
jgi:hypothetical protein